MASTKLVFLIGGSAAYEALTDEFLAAAGGRQARIALLLHGGEHWEKFLPSYTSPWLQRGIAEYYPNVPDASGYLNLEKLQEALLTSTAIFIGGGPTAAYQHYYASHPAAAWIRERYDQGIPIAGVSAGALLAAQTCMIRDEENKSGEPQIVPGLGLVKNVMIGVHFTAMNALPEMVKAMARTRTSFGLGLDDTACAVYEDGRLVGVLGQGVYEVEMSDFELAAYSLKEYKTNYSRHLAAQ